MKSSENSFQRRKRRVRYKIKKVNPGTPRLSVFRSEKHTYAQIIDDTQALTLVSANTLQNDFKKMSVKSSSNIEAASQIGSLIAKKALEKGIEFVIFDRGGYLFHGRIKALADAAVTSGLNFRKK